MDQGEKIPWIEGKKFYRSMKKKSYGLRKNNSMEGKESKENSKEKRNSIENVNLFPKITKIIHTLVPFDQF